MTLMAQSGGDVQVKIIKGDGEWYMVYIGSILTIQVEQNEGQRGYYYKSFRTSRCCNLSLPNAMSDALKGLRLPEEQHNTLMQHFRRAVERLREEKKYG